MTYLEESRAAGRILFPDLARAWALFGIALVNVGIFAYPPYLGGYAYGGLQSDWDSLAYLGVNGLFLMKSYTLFAFMFGVGFAYQLTSAERVGARFSARYWRRILGLFFFAAVNIALFFQGDILFIYAVMGSCLFLFRNLSGAALIRWAIGLYLLQILLLAGFAGFTALGNAFAPDEMALEAEEMAVAGAKALDVFGGGTFGETVTARIAEWTEGVVFMFLFQGVGALSFFLFGLAAVRTRLIATPGAPFWRKARRYYLLVGLVISSAAAWLMLDATSLLDDRMMVGLALIALGAPFATAGYLGLLAKWSLAPDGPIKTFMARGGTATLTAYLLQNMLFTLIFYGFGLGYYAQLPAAICIAIAAGVALVSLVFTSVWRTQFKRGPLEHLLRSWTYLKFS